MNGEKDSYRHTWTYDLNGTSSGERSAFCEKSAVVYAFDWRARGRAWPARQPHCHNDRVRGRPGGGPVPLPLMTHYEYAVPGPLSDLRVVEIAQLIAGPFCGQLFGDFGAEIL